jgi:hypothetical protein
VPGAIHGHCATFATQLLVANGDQERSRGDADDLVRVVRTEPATFAWADALPSDDQLARSVRWGRDHAFGSIRGKLVHNGQGPKLAGADRLLRGWRRILDGDVGPVGWARVHAFVCVRASVMH